MKKIAYVLLVIAMFLCLTACSQDQYAKLGELMGKISGNVYGIKPDMKDVDAATEKVDDTVKVDEKGVVTVEVKSEDARSIVDSVIAVKDSSSKREALQESLDEPILGKDATDKQKAEVKEQLAGQAAGSKITDTTGYSDSRMELAAAVNYALDQVESSLSDNPTKAELATFATIKTLADAVKSGDTKVYKEAGKKAIDALTITSEVAGIDLFADVNITDLVNNIMDRSISRDGDDADFSKWLPVVSKSAASIIRCMTGSGKKFSEQRYSKFIMECRAVKAAFEMMATAYSDEKDIDAILTKNIDLGLTIESLGRYVMAVVFVGINDYTIWDDAPGEKVGIIGFLNEYVSDNYDALTNLAENYKNLPNPTDKESKYYQSFGYAMTCFANRLQIVSMDFENFDELVEAIRKSLDEEGSLSAIAFNSLSVTGMILVDSEYTSLLSLGDMDGKLSTLQKIITGKEVNK